MSSTHPLSPPTASTDRAIKLPIYVREKVSHVWLVDPLRQTPEVFRLDGSSYRLAGVWRGDVAVQREPLEAGSKAVQREPFEAVSKAVQREPLELSRFDSLTCGRRRQGPDVWIEIFQTQPRKIF